jgi:phosphoglycerate dehydrogenase-like enzyme
VKNLNDGAIFVNTSAGRLVDQDALFEELESGRIFAYLDVYEGLPPRQRFKNVSLKDNLFT